MRAATLAGAGLLVFASLGAAGRAGALDGVDRAIGRVLHAPRATPEGEKTGPRGPRWLLKASWDLSSLGSYPVLSLACVGSALFLVLRGEKAVAARILAVNVGAMLLSTTANHAVGRPRPAAIAHGVHFFSESFPSGHAMVSLVIYVALVRLLEPVVGEGAPRRALHGIAAFIIVVVGLSRAHLGLHHPTDVLGGWALGLAVSPLAWWAASRRPA